MHRHRTCEPLLLFSIVSCNIGTAPLSAGPLGHEASEHYLDTNNKIAMQEST